ncbi:MAG: hypothetical protein KGJ86_10130 [Chloroflexota bacterium]|nr:hypothetical protein [Chloroflexota bacterium]
MAGAWVLWLVVGVLLTIWIWREGQRFKDEREWLKQARPTTADEKG